jgi:lysophospholipase L1-like esterase
MTSKPKITIVAFGDSITEAGHQALEHRWPEILQHALQAQFVECDITMVNAGAGGNTSREGLRRFEKDVLSHAPQFVLVEFGNDGTPEPNRQVSVDEFIRNLDLIREGVEKRYSGTVILLTFPPIIDQWHSWRDHEFYKRIGGLDVWQENYRKATRKLALARRMPLCDIDRALRERIAVHGPGDCILPDGVHLTIRGNQCVAETVLKTLAPAIEKYLKALQGEK